MRLLVAITSGFGHIRPSAPIAAAARRRGHEVRYVVSSPDRLMSGNSRGSGAIAPSEFAAGLGFPTDVVEPADITSLVAYEAMAGTVCPAVPATTRRSNRTFREPEVQEYTVRGE